jgi:hypothetical protein
MLPSHQRTTERSQARADPSALFATSLDILRENAILSMESQEKGPTQTLLLPRTRGYSRVNSGTIWRTPIATNLLLWWATIATLTMTTAINQRHWRSASTPWQASIFGETAIPHRTFARARGSLSLALTDSLSQTYDATRLDSRSGHISKVHKES